MELASLFSAAVTLLLVNLTFSVAENYIEAFNKCFQESGASKGDGQVFMDTGVASENLKCAFHCVADHYDTVLEDGTYNQEKSVALLPRVMQESTRKCAITAPGTSADPCEKAYQFHKCLLEAQPQMYRAIGSLTLKAA